MEELCLYFRPRCVGTVKGLAQNCWYVIGDGIFFPPAFYGAVSFGVREGGEEARLPDQPIPDWFSDLQGMEGTQTQYAFLLLRNICGTEN